jgi:Uma2 family endonuclease
MGHETTNTGTGLFPLGGVSTVIGSRARAVFKEQLEIPLGLTSLEDFRCWAASDNFPQSGRIDCLAGRIEVDMAPEDIFCHGVLKTELAAVLYDRIKRQGRGRVFLDCTRVSTPQAELSVEPDILFVSHASLTDGRIRMVPKAGGQHGRFIEFEGAADLIVEIVSDSSVTKDTKHLPPAYWKAGVGEFWLVDARGEELIFRIHRRGSAAFEPTSVDADGFQHSLVLECRYRLVRREDRDGYWAFELVERPLS